jgi:hypothetical protein
MDRLITIIGTALAAAIVAVPSVAWACPYCVTQNKDAGMAGVMLLGAIIGLPFVIFLVVVPILRRAVAEDAPLFPAESE